ncbi:MAG: ADP-dependent glucokinase, partial [Firmicutes bacterium]|nr:ADP-dependent glucokinase [Bacillota bacterium]
DYSSGEQTRDAMLFAATLAASRSTIGRVGTPEEIRDGLNVPTAEQLFPLMAELAQELEEEKFMETGIATKNGRRIVLVPTKLVAKPVLTVGLGDLISSSSFILG